MRPRWHGGPHDNAGRGRGIDSELPVASGAERASSRLVVAISSRALFDLADSHRIYEEEGLEAYRAHQIAAENEILQPGVAFNLVNKLLKLNEVLEQPEVEVILLSRNSADTGLRIFHSIQHYGLAITRAAFCSGNSPYRYISAFDSQLFLSLDGADVRQALESGVAAATIVPSTHSKQSDDHLKIAFDGDAVLFSDASEKIFQEEGLESFARNERDSAREPLEGGPFKSFLSALHRIQTKADAPISTCLITARSAPAHERVVRTLRAWNIRIDESLFLGGLPKKDFLRAYEADIFFDDQLDNCDAASDHVTTGHVPHGVLNAQGS